MTRLTMLFIAVALVLPGAALSMPSHDVGGTQPQSPAQSLAAPDRDPGTRAAFAVKLDKHGVDQAAAHRKAAAVGRYYASDRTAGTSLSGTQAPAASDGNGLSWSIAIGVGIALMLVAGGHRWHGRMVRPRHIGA